LRFVQISDSHIGFHGPPTSTSPARSPGDHPGQRRGIATRLRDAHRRLTHLSTAASSTRCIRCSRSAAPGKSVTCPANTTRSMTSGQKYRASLRRRTRGDGWYSFDIKGVTSSPWSTPWRWRTRPLGVDQLDFIQRDSPACPATPHRWCSATSRCSRCTRCGGGAPRSHPGTVLPTPFLLGDLPEWPCAPAVLQDRGQRPFYSATTTAIRCPTPDKDRPVPLTCQRRQLGMVGIRESPTTRPICPRHSKIGN